MSFPTIKLENSRRSVSSLLYEWTCRPAWSGLRRDYCKFFVLMFKDWHVGVQRLVTLKLFSCFRYSWIKYPFLLLLCLQTGFWYFTFRALLWKPPARVTAELLPSDFSLASSVQFPGDRGWGTSLVMKLWPGRHLRSWASPLQTFFFFPPSSLNFTLHQYFCSLSSQ